MAQVATQPSELINDFFMRGHKEATGPRDPYNPPELETAYPEPSVFGILSAYGMYSRHVNGLIVRDVKITCQESDERAPIVLQDVENSRFDSVDAHHLGDSTCVSPQQCSWF